MKVKILHILCFFTLLCSGCFHINTFVYASTSSQSEDSFLLVNNYIENYKKRFNATYRLYRSDISPEALTINKKLNGIQKSLENTKSSNLSPSQKQKIIKNQIQILETVYSEAKNYLRFEQQIYIEKLQKQHTRYTQISLQITEQIDLFIQKMSHYLRQKKSLNSIDKKAVIILVKMREENNKLKAFTSQGFSSEQDMKQYLQKHIFEIRSEFQKLKNLY